MPVPISIILEEKKRCINDLIRNANSSDYCNERGFKQKLIVELYNMGYYSNNETIFLTKKDNNGRRD